MRFLKLSLVLGAGLFAFILSTRPPARSLPLTALDQATPYPLTLDPSEFTPTTDFPAAIEGAIGPDNFPPDVNPLTGLRVSDPAVLNRRPIVAKISNGPPLVRPQHGIGQADIVYEHYTEGGITRFSAIFYSQTPRKVGSVRSARLIDYELTEMYKGLLAFSGGSGGVEQKLFGSEFAARAYKGVLYGPPYFWRDEAIDIPHNMFFDPAALWEIATRDGHLQRPLLRGMAFHPDPPPDSSADGTSIDIRYRATRVQWRYDPAAGVYWRWADGLPHFDAGIDRQVSAENVVVIYAGHYPTDIVEAEYRGSVSWSTQITLWPQGHAELFRDGLRYSGQWVRLTRPDLLGLRTDDGELLYLKPGTTFFQVVPLPEQMNSAEEWVRWE